jgi:hypothetical protein
VLQPLAGHAAYVACRSVLPATATTATIISPVNSSRTPALAPKIFSIVSSKTRKSDAPQIPGTLARPPTTDVPPMTTTAMEASRYSLPISTLAPWKWPSEKRAS